VTTQTVTREHLLDTAISRLFDLSLKQRAGEGGPEFSAFFNSQVEPAVDAALAAGWASRDVYGGADRRYGQWLIGNARMEGNAA
jgi:hypothetical protein